MVDFCRSRPTPWAGQNPCKPLVKSNANAWSSPCNYATVVITANRTTVATILSCSSYQAARVGTDERRRRRRPTPPPHSTVVRVIPRDFSLCTTDTDIAAHYPYATINSANSGWIKPTPSDGSIRRVSSLDTRTNLSSLSVVEIEQLSRWLSTDSSSFCRCLNWRVETGKNGTAACTVYPLLYPFQRCNQ